MKPKSNFTIIIATRWASEYLKLCIETLKKHSDLDNEIIIAADYPSWQTLKYIQENNLPYILTNFGHQCMAWNTAARFSTREYIAITGDDVVFGPGWDTALMEIARKGVVGGIREHNPSNAPDFGYFSNGKNGSLNTFNLDQFMKYGIDHVRNEHLIGVSWPMLFHKETFWKYGGLTFHSAREHAHDVRLVNRLTEGTGGKSILSLKSFSYHFGHTGNRDGVSRSYLSTEYRDGIRICAGCQESEEGFGGNELRPGSLEIFDRGYWLCKECKTKDNVVLRKLPIKNIEEKSCLN